MTTLETLFGTKKKHRWGCPVCGEKNAAMVAVRAMELGENGQVGKGLRSASRARSFCAVHAADIYERAVAVIIEES